MKFLCQLIQKLQPEQTDTQTDRHTHTQTHTDRHTHTDMTKTLPLPHTREVIIICAKLPDTKSLHLHLVPLQISSAQTGPILPCLQIET